MITFLPPPDGVPIEPIRHPYAIENKIVADKPFICDRSEDVKRIGKLAEYQIFKGFSHFMWWERFNGKSGLELSMSAMDTFYAKHFQKVKYKNILSSCGCKHNIVQSTFRQHMIYNFNNVNTIADKEEG